MQYNMQLSKTMQINTNNHSETRKGEICGSMEVSTQKLQLSHILLVQFFMAYL